MRCENCAHLLSEGYEYPETYCELGITNEHKRATENGCNLSKTERRRICRKLEGLWWDESKE